AETRVASVLQNVGHLAQNVVTLLAISGILLTYSIFLPLLLLLSTLPALLVVARHHRRQHSWWEQSTETRRWVAYYDLVLTARQFAAELRIFQLNGHFQAAYRALRKVLREGQLRLVRQQSLGNLSASLLAFVFMGVAMAWMALQLMAGSATLGDLALFYAAFSQGQGLMRTLLSSVGQLYGDSLFLSHLFAFLAIHPRMRDTVDGTATPARLEKSIEIRNVSFRYPGTEQLALRQFNMTIPAGKIVAIVGPNGAGKSTLIKLLCRFYDPESGTVSMDGVDVRRIGIEQLWRRMTVLFQDYVNYAGTVGESITMGDLFSDHSRERVEAAAQIGGAYDVARRLAHGFDTILGKQFRGGVDLSSGQFQRVALSRTFYRDAPIVILDEPTSYMDSWAEAGWLDRFCDAMRGRTAIVVTHRFTTAMRADVIFVLNEGRVEESGSHAALLARNGLYAKSWRAQVRAGGTETGEQLAADFRSTVNV
ncbi:MAG: ABC transporter ATP-binding protein, partial [Longimicrobiales bacterium]